MTREQFHAELCTILGSNHVYYNPPENVKIEFPAIVYRLETPSIVHADNGLYWLHIPYRVTLIQKETSDELWTKLAAFPLCRPGNPFISDGLRHYVFTIYL